MSEPPTSGGDVPEDLVDAQAAASYFERDPATIRSWASLYADPEPQQDEDGRTPPTLRRYGPDGRGRTLYSFADLLDVHAYVSRSRPGPRPRRPRPDGGLSC